MTARFDHLVVVAPALAEGVAWVADRLGVTVPPGGAHPMMGTHNRLMRLSPTSFFEIIAIDPTAPPPGRARWFGMDTPPAATQLVTWLAAVPNVAAARAASPIDPGPPVRVTRGTLSWQITVPDDGALAEGGTVPSFIEWPGPHPALAMADLGCRLISLDLTHPHPDLLRSVFMAIELNGTSVQVTEGPAAVSALISTPRGAVRLSPFPTL